MINDEEIISIIAKQPAVNAVIIKTVITNCNNSFLFNH